MKISASTLLASLLFCAVSHAQPQPTLSLDFETGVNALGRDGKNIEARVEGKSELVTGKFGQAFKSGPSSGYLHFPTNGVLRPDEGTVEMWVCPVDWDGTEKKFHVFFDVRGDGALYLYKFFNGGLLLLSAPDLAGPFRNATKIIDDWKRGEWHHIAGTWSATQQHLYIDGQLAASTNPGTPRRLDATFMLGDHPWNEASVAGRTSSSLIDRVRIYDRALSPEHIAAHFAGNYETRVPLTEKLLSVRYSLNPVTYRIAPVVDSGGADVDANQDVLLEVRQGEKVLTKSTARFAGSLAKTEFPLDGLMPGEYELRATVRGANNESFSATKSFRLQEKPVLDASWKGNKIGEMKKIPPPWTPLQVKRNKDGFSVSCWGREYHFGASAWPLQITSQNQPLLASPVALKVLAGGRELKWTNASAQTVSQSPEAVEITGRAQAENGVMLTTKFRLEYDGVMVADFNFKTPPQFKADSVTLNLPVRPNNALYRHRWTAKWEGNSGNVPMGVGVVEKQNFTPFAWLGDNDRGLFWFCETGQFWPHHKGDNAYETVREKGAITMRLNLAQGEAIPSNWNYRFGLQATPVKPIARNWRKHRIAPVPAADVRPTVEILWPTPGAPYAHKWFGYPEAANEIAAREHLVESRGKGLKTIPYTTLTQIWSDVPEWLFFNREWNMLRPSEHTTATGVNYNPEYEWVLPTPPDYSDWMAWKHMQYLKKFGYDGYYIDQVHPYQTTREEAGGWKDASSTWQPVYPILAYRDLYRRLYIAVKEANPNAFIMHHMSGKVGIPYLAYADAYLDGEHFRGQFADGKNDSYMDVISPDAFRAEYMGRQWGIAPYFLPELWSDGAPAADTLKVEPSLSLASLLLVHDVSPWVIWAHPKPFEDAFRALDAFGYIDSEFIPYFDSTPPATTDMKDVYVSVYKRRDGRALAIVANLSEEPKSGNITLNAKRIGVPTDKVLAWPDKSTLSRNGDKIAISLPKHGYRMLLIGKAP